jgi:hypothetical protein
MAATNQATAATQGEGLRHSRAAPQRIHQSRANQAAAINPVSAAATATNTANAENAGNTANVANAARLRLRLPA